MARERRRARSGQDENILIKALRFGTIPLIVIILIIIILCMDRPGESGSDESSASGVSSHSGQQEGGDGGSGQAAGYDEDREDPDRTEEDGSGQQPDSQAEDGRPDAAPAADPSQYAFQQDAILELTGLVQSYCEAKEECDPELLSWVFGIDSWSEEEKKEEQARMELVKASVKAYLNISCYSIQGPEPDSYVIFPYYEIRYRETETLMPAFSWGYARKDESGRFYMVQEIDETVRDYIRKTGEKPEVKAVMAQILARQQQAIASDEVLQKIYKSTGESEVIIGGVSG